MRVVVRLDLSRQMIETSSWSTSTNAWNALSAEQPTDPSRQRSRTCGPPRSTPPATARPAPPRRSGDGGRSAPRWSRRIGAARAPGRMARPADRRAAGFTTHATLERPDGSQVEWTSRRHRKGLGLRLPDGHRLGRWSNAGAVERSAEPVDGRALRHRLGVLRRSGRCRCTSTTSSPTVLGATFFVGSIFFTTAAYLQFHETLAAPGGVLADSAGPGRLASLVGWTPRRIDWWAGARPVRRHPLLQPERRSRRPATH